MIISIFYWYISIIDSKTLPQIVEKKQKNEKKGLNLDS